ncbi:MAG: multicopper oxidase domain-containing protein [Rhodospirillaceae bacterium]|nr:multicopper oxidase domain-containing protein [Rhodospirillaceae bacterium]
MSARGFLGVLALIAGLFSISAAEAEQRKFEMDIQEVEITVAPGFKAKVWAFNGQVPGPLLHVKEGDDVEVVVHNKSTQAHTVHWHGVYQFKSWASDGTPNVTQKNILPGESHTYRFVAEKAGSLWYHCHTNVAEHLGLRGMFGPLIIEPKKPTKIERQVTKDAVLMFSGWNDRVAQKLGEGMKPGEALQYFSINGRSMPLNQPIRVKTGDVVRLRLYAATIPVAFHLHGHDFLVTHKDGNALEHPYSADVIGMQPGERIDAIVRMNNPGIWASHDHIDDHTTNNGQEHGGSMLTVEYDEIEKPPFYMWKNVNFKPDFYMIESMAKPFGLHNIDVLKGVPAPVTGSSGAAAVEPAHNHQ